MAHAGFVQKRTCWVCAVFHRSAIGPPQLRQLAAPGKDDVAWFECIHSTDFPPSY